MPKGVVSGVTIDDSEFRRKAVKLARKFGVDERKFIKEQTGILAREVAKFTPPFASFPKLSGTSIGTAKDIRAGKWAVHNDIAKICTVKLKGEITKARKKWGTGPIAYGGRRVALGIIDDTGTLADWHKKNRGPGNRTRALTGDNRYWVSSPVFKKYVKDQQANVGIAKAAFYKASLDLNAKGAAPVAVKNSMTKTIGTGRVTKARKGPTGIITGRAGGLYHTNKFLPTLRKNRLIKATKRLQILARQAAKGSGFKTR